MNRQIQQRCLMLAVLVQRLCKWELSYVARQQLQLGFIFYTSVFSPKFGAFVCVVLWSGKENNRLFSMLRLFEGGSKLYFPDILNVNHLSICLATFCRSYLPAWKHPTEQVQNLGQMHWLGPKSSTLKVTDVSLYCMFIQAVSRVFICIVSQLQTILQVLLYCSQVLLPFTITFIPVLRSNCSIFWKYKREDLVLQEMWSVILPLYGVHSC